MSYAGTYGADETCPHDHYWPNCRYCSLIGPRPTEEQKQLVRERQKRRKEAYLQHPEDILRIEAKPRTIIVYDAVCPNPECEWTRHGVSKEQLEADIQEHGKRAWRTVAMWIDVDPDEAYVEP